MSLLCNNMKSVVDLAPDLVENHMRPAIAVGVRHLHEEVHERPRAVLDALQPGVVSRHSSREVPESATTHTQHSI